MAGADPQLRARRAQYRGGVIILVVGSAFAGAMQKNKTPENGARPPVSEFAASCVTGNCFFRRRRCSLEL